MEFDDFKLSKKSRLKYYLLSIAGLFACGMLFYNNIILAFLLSLASIALEKYYKRHLLNKYKQSMGLEFKDMLVSMSASFTAGRQMRDAITEARDNMLLIFPSDAPINTELKSISLRLESGAEKEKDILFEFASRSQNEDVQSFVDVYYTCLTTGGDIIKAVNRATEIIIDKISIRKDLETQMAQKKYEAKILTLIPVVILLFLRLNSPDYLDPLYGNPLGILIMTAAITCLVVSFFWSGKIMNVKV